MVRAVRALVVSMIVGASAAWVAGPAVASGNGASIDVTFTGHGTGKMTLGVNHQSWEKDLDWKLTWTIRPGSEDLQSTSESVSGGTSSYDGDKGYPPKHVVFCKGGVKASGAHAILGTFAYPSSGLGKPTKGVTVSGFPTLAEQHAAKHWGEVQVPIFGGVADACFGPSVMAVSGGSYQQEDAGMIYAIFPFNLSHPASGDYHLHRAWSYSGADGTDDYNWDGTVTVIVHHAG